MVVKMECTRMIRSCMIVASAAQSLADCLSCSRSASRIYLSGTYNLTTEHAKTTVIIPE
jgi:hypothetical protein